MDITYKLPVSINDSLSVLFFHLAVALAIGLLLGSERERSNPDPSAPGVRTFAILSLTGAISVIVNPYLILPVTLSAALIAITPTITRKRKKNDPPGYGATTIAAASATPILGALAMYNVALSAAVGVVIAVILVSKNRVHTFIKKTVKTEELTDALKFFVIALIILPLLPDRTFDPYEVINPRKIGLLVTALTGIGWLGYIAVRSFGAKKGLPVAGLAGGFVSSTATTVAMARQGKNPEVRNYAIVAALLSKVSSILVLAALILVISPKLFTLFTIPLIVSLLMILSTSFFYMRRGKESLVTHENLEELPLDIGRPFALKPALILALIITLTLIISKIVVDLINPNAIVFISAITGLADTQAPAVAASTLVSNSGLPLQLGLLSIIVALIANSLLKIGLAYSAGGKDFAKSLTLALTPFILGLIVSTTLVVILL